MVYKLENDKLEFYENIDLKKRKDIYIGVSGGTDSALVLYLTAKEISENLDSSYQIFPICGLDINRSSNLEEIKKIISIISKEFPNVKINTLNSCFYDKYDKNYKNKLRVTLENIKDLKNSVFLTGVTKNLPENLIVPEGTKSKARNNGNEILFNHPTLPDLLCYRPLGNIIKFDIADMYEKFPLLKTIFPYTLSCVNPVPLHSKNPCKKCYWCQEKFLAFGTFDIGKNP